MNIYDQIKQFGNKMSISSLFRTPKASCALQLLPIYIGEGTHSHFTSRTAVKYPVDADNIVWPSGYTLVGS